MSHFPHGAFAAIYAAEEQRKRDQEEEEYMTRYTIDELDDNWEFKIVRSETGSFRRPEVFQSLLQEESVAGWELVEKLDNRRVRFKRRRDARRRDATLPPGMDPYRSQYGGSTARKAILLGVVFMVALGIGAAVMANFSIFPAEFPVIITTVGVIVLLVAVILVVVSRSR
jgi:hypothetical protein